MCSRYDDIEPAYERQITKISEQVRVESKSADVQFVVLEKADGANFAFVTNGYEVQYWSREVQLDKDANFIRKNAPAHEFYAFAVCVNHAYLDVNISVQLWKQSGFPCLSEPLQSGTFAECIAYAESAVDTCAT